jgi:hypothetical protein
MSEVNDKCRRSTRISASHDAEPTSGANSLATTRKRKDPPGPRLTPRNHKRTNIADNGPPTTDPKSYAIATRTKCFRISGIPQDWKEDDLLGALQSVDSDLRNQKSQLSLYPACCGSSQTALLELDTTKYFESLGPNESYKRVSLPSKTEAVLTIDSDFYGLTPLNTPDKQIIAELAAPRLPISMKRLTHGSLQCSCCDRPCRPCIWVLEESGDSPNVAERLLTTGCQGNPDYVLRL